MTTSWSELRLIEQYISGKLDAPEKLVFEARLLVDPFLRINVWAHKMTLALIQRYGREKLRKKLASIHKVMLRDQDWPGRGEHLREYFK